ncbi:MAG TPA: vWA domain-containing protein [Jiangellaceae bacterium]
MRPAVIFLTAVAVTTNTVAGASTPAGGGTASGDSSVPVEVVLVLDASSSVRYGPDPANRDARVRNITIAAWSVLDAVGEAARVDARVSVVSYDKDVRIQVPPSAVTSGTTGADGVFGQALGDPTGDLSSPSASAGYAEHLRGGNGSNWEAALAEAHHLLGEARADSALVVVHVTDGEPTARIDSDGEPVLSGEPDEHLAAAANAANRLKNDNVRMLAVGIGEARSRLAALVAVSGPDVYDQGRDGEILDPATHDVILLEDPESLGSIFSSILAIMAEKPDPDRPSTTAKSGMGAAEVTVLGWPWVVGGGAAAILLIMLAFGALGRRRRHQMLGVGAAARRRRATME